VACLGGAASAAARQPPGGEQDPNQYEETAFQAAVERAARHADSEGRRWLRELTQAYPGRVGPGLAQADVEGWYVLLAGEEKEWRRAAAPTRGVAELFDRATKRMELGPVPSLRREEFQQFARRHLAAPQESRESRDRPSEAGRVFRVLDRDGSGLLEPAEWTNRLRAAIGTADANGDRKIDPKEFQAYFDARVNEAAEAQVRAAALRAGPRADPAGALPGWFRELDTDADGQVGLYEWRVAGRPLAEFKMMDLDGDGLLTPEEYRRYLRMAGPSATPAPEAPPGPRASMEK
jgi:hypothetical protein